MRTIAAKPPRPIAVGRALRPCPRKEAHIELAPRSGRGFVAARQGESQIYLNAALIASSDSLRYFSRWLEKVCDRSTLASNVISTPDLVSLFQTTDCAR